MMDKNQIITFIRTVPLFHSLLQEQLEQLAETVQQREYTQGQLLVERDQPAEELVIVVQGELQVFLRDEQIEFERELARIYPGDYFGAVAVISQHRAAASIRAVVPSRALILNRETIDQLFETSPAFGRAICRSLATYLRQSVDQLAAIPFAQLDSFPRLRASVELLPPRVSRFCRSLVVDRDGDSVKVAMVDPSDTRARSFIGDVLHEFRIDFVAISEEDFQRHATKLLGHEVSVLPSEVQHEDLVTVDSSGTIVPISETNAHDVLPRALASAIHSGASDVHIEPFGERGRIRLRIDGKMVSTEPDVAPLVLKQIISRIKVMADLDITNIRRPQDGRTNVQAGDRRVELRVSITPCQGGEKAVLRLMAPSPRLEDLGNLILSRPVAMFVQEIFQNPSGLVLVTGPTGAGKTTTLYAALNMIASRNPALNFVTIEEPVEYNLQFATQIPVNRELGLDFARLLRTVLRQDPDVILVGEIRDVESAAVAAEAAITGHLVLSSLHTYSALETLVRLRNLGVKPYVLANALKGVISQKLVPRLCPGCTMPVSPDDPVVERLQELDILPEGWSGELLQGADRDGCPPGGEAGRVGVYEILSVTEELRRLIEQSAPLSELEATLRADTFFSFARYSRLLLEDGVVGPERIEQIFPKQRFTDIANV